MPYLLGRFTAVRLLLLDPTPTLRASVPEIHLKTIVTNLMYFMLNIHTVTKGSPSTSDVNIVATVAALHGTTCIVHQA
jgi:hypothetical protein